MSIDKQDFCKNCDLNWHNLSPDDRKEYEQEYVFCSFCKNYNSPKNKMLTDYKKK